MSEEEIIDFTDPVKVAVVVTRLTERLIKEKEWGKLSHDKLDKHIEDSNEYRKEIKECVENMKCPKEDEINALLLKDKWKKSIPVTVVLYITAICAIVSIVWGVLRIIPALKELGGE